MLYAVRAESLLSELEQVASPFRFGKGPPLAVSHPLRIVRLSRGPATHPASLGHICCALPVASDGSVDLRWEGLRRAPKTNNGWGVASSDLLYCFK